MLTDSPNPKTDFEWARDLALSHLYECLTLPRRYSVSRAGVEKVVGQVVPERCLFDRKNRRMSIFYSNSYRIDINIKVRRAKR